MEKNDSYYCDECGSTELPSEKILDVIKRYRIPFVCPVCGGIKFPYQALNGIVFLWPKPALETQGSIFIPESVRDNFKTSLAVVLSSGSGVLNKKTLNRVESELDPGDEVMYDSSVPWKVNMDAPDGKKYEVILNNLLDINAKVL